MKKLINLLFSLLILFVFVYAYAVKKEVVPSQAINVMSDGKVVRGINIYKMSEQTKYFSVREIAKIYGAILEWRPVSSQVTMNLKNSKIDIKANSTSVVFRKKLRKMSLPSRLIGSDIYISPEIIVSPEFAEITETDTKWDPSTLTLNIEHYPAAILAVRYFTRPERTQVFVDLKRSLSYTVLKTSNAIILKIFRCRVQRDSINVNNGVVKDIQCGIDGRFSIIKINLAQVPKFIKTSKFSKPDRISVDITHFKNIDISGLTEIKTSEHCEEYTVQDYDDSKKIDLTATEKYEQTQMMEIASIVEDNGNNKDLANVPVKKFENNNIIDDSNNIIVDDTATFLEVMPKNKNTNNKKSCKHKKIIMLDAGHGGEDPGAVGPNGIKEKDINLEIVRELKSIFDDNKDYDIILTRSDDRFIPLAERTNIANEHSADLFVSVHCNANFDRNVNGFEIYFLSEKATDSEAAATAIMENSVLELEGKPTKKRSSLQNVLWSMGANEHMNESSKLSGFILAEVPKRLNIPSRGVKQASFYVLRGTQMPAVLVESAFLSNYAEEAKLCSKKFRTAIAGSIYDGVVKYYAQQEKEQNK
ncbi:MAG: N-acetylmuramoyl-L-alanine amidase [Endomicrobium sp.]|jgi:N-acetylmuramoyl-L-alanine amidase|nr:N-acetylmuramoyl-L-alanine amidase [Endomicrobium sp.]